MWLMRLTWGILDTVIGVFIFLYFALRYRSQLMIGYVGHTIVVQIPESEKLGWGFSAGLFIFSNSSNIWAKGYLLHHEWGHTCPQLLICGPLHPFIVIIPSVIRFWYRNTHVCRTNYDDIWFEGTATRWGERWFKYGEQHNWWN